MDDAERLISPITISEIRFTLWSLKPYKGSRPDGLHVGFFQRLWHIVIDSVKDEVHHIFSLGKVPDYLNKTLITLIPKCPNPESIGNYRLISLCNSIYKVVTKIIVAHIRPKLPDLVSPLQIAFVPGRNGVDNVIIVQELIHSMSKKKGCSGIMAIKIDLEKTYDRLGWSFIRDTLKLFELPDSLIALIMSCVSTSTISVLFNRGALESFQPSRGIRQGDPFSPYLFILCMEVLGAMINEKCNEKLWNPIKASQGGLAFSHLFFVDDLVLFTKADRKNCVAVKKVLDTFYSLPGQKVSATKTKVFFSRNVPIENRESLCEVLGFRSTPNLGKYLGLPIKHTSSA